MTLFLSGWTHVHNKRALPKPSPQLPEHPAGFGLRLGGDAQQNLEGKRDGGLNLQGKWLRKGEEWLYGKRIAFYTAGGITEC